VRESTPDHVRLEVDDREERLSPIDAANIFVVPAEVSPAAPARTLADLPARERAVVHGVTATGFGRRRLFDLGFTPGAVVECAFPSAFGEPRAYRVRGTLIALRPEQARRIELEPAPPDGVAP
jgi:Fe2+ transport system protein FeoA